MSDKRLAAMAADTTNQGYLGLDLSLGQSVSFTGTSAQSAVLATNKVLVYATEDCWVRWGANPVAAATPTGANASLFVKKETYLEITVPVSTYLLAVIRDSTNGTLRIWGAAVSKGI